MGQALVAVYFIALFCKILGIPIAREIPWIWFLIIPLAYLIIKFIWPVFQWIIILLFGWWMMEAVIWFFTPGYHMHIWEFLGSFFSAFWGWLF
jgi:hypothetical protein